MQIKKTPNNPFAQQCWVVSPGALLGEQYPAGRHLGEGLGTTPAKISRAPSHISPSPAAARHFTLLCISCRFYLSLSRVFHQAEGGR